MYRNLVLLSTLAFFLSFLLTKIKIRLGLAIAQPNDRSSHVRATPTGGGFAVLLAFIVFIAFSQSSLDIPLQWRLFSPIIISAFILGFVGLLDDVFCLPAVPRLFIQFALATWVVLQFNLGLNIVLPENAVISGGYAQLAAILWIVGFVNLYNFMDGADGMIPLGTIMSCLLVLIATPSVGLAFIAISIAVAMIGFLPLNFPRARIFLGDSGSQSFGFLLACLLLSAHNVQPARFSLYTMVLAFMPYLYDAGSTTLIRLFTGKNILKPHREFMFHRLMDMGYKHQTVSCLYMVILLICGIGVEFSSRTYVLNHFIAMMVGLFFCTLLRSVVIYYGNLLGKTKQNKHLPGN